MFVLVLMFFFAPFSLKAEGPVIVSIKGIEGLEFQNVRTALTLPAGLVKNGIADEKWLKRFEQQIPQKAKEAIEPFGLYNPTINVSSALTIEGVYEVKVFIEPGEPVRVTSIRVSIKGPGKDEEKLVELAASFPLRKGAVLRQDIYETAKKNIRAKAIEIGYLDADFITHAIRVTPEELAADIELVMETGARIISVKYIFPERRSIRKPFLAGTLNSGLVIFSPNIRWS